jgi:hypothetical protein
MLAELSVVRSWQWGGKLEVVLLSHQLHNVAPLEHRAEACGHNWWISTPSQRRVHLLGAR